MENFSILGIVIKGEGVARGLNYPTANIDIGVKIRDLETGVYAGRVVLLGIEYNAAVIIKKEPDKVEIHLIDYFGKDFYGNSIEVMILSKVNEIEKLAGQSLRDKIEQDMIKVKIFFSV